jgi:Na+/H+ antiporter NhaD/arsenite permease-like protein
MSSNSTSSVAKCPSKDAKLVNFTQAFVAIDMGTLALLFWTMLISEYLRVRANAFAHITRFLKWRSGSDGRILLIWYVPRFSQSMTRMVSVPADLAGASRALHQYVADFCFHRVAIISGIVAAVFTNDIVCVAFTPLIIDICRDQNLPFQVCSVIAPSCARRFFLSCIF